MLIHEIVATAERILVARDSSGREVHQAVQIALSAGHVELHTNPDDRRILQVRLTAAGRSELSGRRAREAGWLIEHLNGLGLHEITATAHILNVLRRRLAHAERERRERR